MGESGEVWEGQGGGVLVRDVRGAGGWRRAAL